MLVFIDKDAAALRVVQLVCYQERRFVDNRVELGNGGGVAGRW